MQLSAPHREKFIQGARLSIRTASTVAGHGRGRGLPANIHGVLAPARHAFLRDLAIPVGRLKGAFWLRWITMRSVGFIFAAQISPLAVTGMPSWSLNISAYSRPVASKNRYFPCGACSTQLWSPLWTCQYGKSSQKLR